MLYSLKKLLPSSWLYVYHRALSWLAAAIYGNPSNKLVVVGITGTNGKTTTAYLTAKALEASGFPTGCTTTAIFKIGEREWLNKTKMTMLGRFGLQKMLNEMVKAGCRYAVIETSSQGILQHRHAHVNYDIAIFTNLTPEHIEAHGGFENYKRAKIELFRHAAACPRKVFNGLTIPKVAVLNAGDEHAKDFAVKGFDRTLWYSSDTIKEADLTARNIQHNPLTTAFMLGEVRVVLNLPGIINVENALAALGTCSALNVDLGQAARKLEDMQNMPGRFELVDEGQPWTVMVDYAPEPVSLSRLYEIIKKLPKKRLIHVLGSCGGGRDIGRRPILGKMAGENADVVIVTNEDPYDDDPRVIMEQVAEGARKAGKKDGVDLFIVENRYVAIYEAMRLCEPGDFVLLTGKGSEQAICVAGGQKIPWDEREVARKAIRAKMGKGGGKESRI
ncbi:UDP-N-acetylmuramoyl-L-alanyl-D-glutamate--2,6-diaminopimelate ligase [Patescibacteria group bacterium]|nr:UDP-N-acetylmuramoyl-L-alanyl-D-glutamate--2,6-diaminopimelate ligase [Patescibacteria group bacterium]